MYHHVHVSPVYDPRGEVESLAKAFHLHSFVTNIRFSACTSREQPGIISEVLFAYYNSQAITSMCSLVARGAFPHLVAVDLTSIIMSTPPIVPFYRIAVDLSPLLLLPTIETLRLTDVYWHTTRLPPYSNLAHLILCGRTILSPNLMNLIAPNLLRLSFLNFRRCEGMPEVSNPDLLLSPKFPKLRSFHLVNRPYDQWVFMPDTLRRLFEGSPTIQHIGIVDASMRALDTLSPSGLPNLTSVAGFDWSMRWIAWSRAVRKFKILGVVTEQQFTTGLADLQDIVRHVSRSTYNILELDGITVNQEVSMERLLTGVLQSIRDRLRTLHVRVASCAAVHADPAWSLVRRGVREFGFMSRDLGGAQLLELKSFSITFSECSPPDNLLENWVHRELSAACPALESVVFCRKSRVAGADRDAVHLESPQDRNGRDATPFIVMRRHQTFDEAKISRNGWWISHLSGTPFPCLQYLERSNDQRVL